MPPLRSPLVSWSAPPGCRRAGRTGTESEGVFGRASSEENVLVSWNVGLPKRPVEAQFLIVRLLDFDEFGLDFDLRGDIDVAAAGNNRIDQIQLILRIPHDEPTGARQINRRCGSIELNTIRDQPVFGRFLHCNAAAAFRRITRRAAFPARGWRGKRTARIGGASRRPGNQIRTDFPFSCHQNVGIHALGDHEDSVQARP